MRVLIHEPGATGHRLPYVSHLVRGLAELGAETVFATAPTTPRSPSFELHLGALAGRFELVELDVRADESDATRRLAALRGAVERARPDHCLLMYADGISQLAGLRALARLPSARVGSRFGAGAGAPHVHALHFRGRHGYPYAAGRRGLVERAKRALSLRATLAAPWTHLHHLDAHQLDAMRAADPSLEARSSVMPDPVEPPPPLSRAAAREALGLPADARTLGCVGVLDGRKGVPPTLDAFRRLRARGAADVLRLAGPVHVDLRGLIEARHADLVAAGALVLDDRTLSADELYAAILATDVVVAAYDANHTGSSSIVVRAAAAGRPVVCTATDWFERTVPRFGLGVTCDPTDPDAFDAALVEALGAGTADRAGFFRRFHAADNFAATWLAPLCALEGVAARRPALSWDAAPAPRVPTP